MATVSLNNVTPFQVERKHAEVQAPKTIAFRGENAEAQLKGQPVADELVTKANINQELKPVATWRAVLKRLPQSTIDQVNETGKLPPNMMVTMNPQTGQSRLAWKTPIFDGRLTGGTDLLPPTHELRKNILGFTILLPKGYNHWLVQNGSQKTA